MVPQTNTKANTNHNWINTNKPLGVGTNLGMAEPIDSKKEGHLQSRSQMNITRRQSPKEPRENLKTASKQEEDPYPAQQPTEQQISEQPTLHSVGSLAYCMDERGNLGNGISIHGPRSQGPRTLLVVITKATT